MIMLLLVSLGGFAGVSPIGKHEPYVSICVIYSSPRTDEHMFIMESSVFRRLN